METFFNEPFFLSDNLYWVLAGILGMLLFFWLLKIEITETSLLICALTGIVIGAYSFVPAIILLTAKLLKTILRL